MITSRNNSLARHARAVRARKIHDLILIEGVRLGEEAARSGLIVEETLHTEKLASDLRGRRLLLDLSRISRRISLVSDEVLASISDTRTPQGIVLLARRPQTDRATFEKRITGVPLIVVAHQLSNPSNAGAILRVAEAAGSAGVITTENSTDLFAPKALRGAMGSSFRLPLWTNARFSEVLEWCAERAIRTLSTSSSAPRSYMEIDWKMALAVIIGAEASGLAPNEITATDEAIRIPMRRPVESLNVAVSLAVLLYEAARQRDRGE